MSCLETLMGHVEQVVRRGAPTRPTVTLAYAQSLDGCITTAPGTTCQISNEESSRFTHRLRAMHDAILVGINTVLVDDPRLNVRHAEGRDPRPLVLDSSLRTPLTARLLQGRPLIAAAEDACRDREAALVREGAEVWRIPRNGSGLDLAWLLERLSTLGVSSVMIEGGARVITTVLHRRLADQVVLTLSPRFLGGVHAVQPTNGGAAPRLEGLQCHPLGGDLILMGKLR